MPRRFPAGVVVVFLVLTATLWPGATGAHDFSITDVLAVLKSGDTYVIDMTLDVDALALGVAPDSDSAENAARLETMSAAEFELQLERARDTLLRRVRIRFDGVKQRPAIDFPDLGSPSTEETALPTVLGTTVRLTGVVPEGASEFTFGASRSFRAVHLTILDQATASGVKHVLVPSEDSPPYAIGQPAVPADRSEIAGRYVVLGFTHILPLGLDHILFVLGLFLFSTRLAPLLWQITAFTVAHSLTLALAMVGIVSLPSRLVESLIALSIVYVAVENLVTTELKPWRVLLVFSFGLLHGLGFAGVLHELGLPEGELPIALIGFNAGVELGQLAVVLLALLAVGWFRNHVRYRTLVVLPLSIAIAVTGLYWAIQRSFGGG